MDFEKICMMFTMQEPFYGILLSSMERIPNSTVGTIGVTRSGNVFKLFYNPAFMAPLPIDTQLTILKHECLHLAFNHFSIWEDNNVSSEERELRNWACDMEVNGYLDKSKLKTLSPVLASLFNWPDQLGTLEYYKRLKQTASQPQSQQQQAQQPQKPCNGGQGGKQQSQSQQQNQPQQQPGNPSQSTQNPQMASNGGAPALTDSSIPQALKDKCSQFDDHSQWPVCGNETEQQIMQQIIDDMVDFAAEECEKGRGAVPAEMKGRIDSIRNKKKPKPAADWKRYFRRYMGNEFTEFIRKSKKRESRRFPDAAGNRHRRKSHILVAIDTSGSVSMPEYREFMGQIRTLYATADFHVVECDACIQHEYDFKGKIPEELHGGGGTDFQPVVDLFNKNKRKYDALVYFTDGYCPVPNDTPQDTLWVISSKGTDNRKPFRKNGASVVKIPPQSIQ
jgi:predicted metal-dependent peptidase